FAAPRRAFSLIGIESQATQGTAFSFQGNETPSVSVGRELRTQRAFTGIRIDLGSIPSSTLSVDYELEGKHMDPEGMFVIERATSGHNAQFMPFATDGPRRSFSGIYHLQASLRANWAEVYDTRFCILGNATICGPSGSRLVSVGAPIKCVAVE